MMVVVRLFARARDLAGSETVNIELAEGATVEQLRQQLASVMPALASLLQRSAIAVNNEFAEQGTPLHGQDEIALVPPVSGG